MLVDIFLKNGSMHFDQNDSNVKHNTRTLLMGKIRRLQDSSFRKLRICLEQGSYSSGKTWKKGLFGKKSGKTWKTQGIF